MKPDFETTSIVGWKYIFLFVNMRKRTAYFRAPIRRDYYTSVQDLTLFPDEQPTVDNRHGLYFWAYDFRLPVRPQYRTELKHHHYFVCGVAARVSVPCGHYAIVATNGVGRASALRIDRIVFPHPDDCCDPDFAAAFDRAKELGFPVAMPVLAPTDYVFLTPADFEIRSSTYVYVDATGFRIGNVDYDDGFTGGACWRQLRDTLTQHGIL